MNAATHVRPAPKLYFKAWRISPDNPRGEATPCVIGEAHTLKEAIDAALTGAAFQHKDTLAVLAIDNVGGASTLHTYAIKQDTKAPYVFDPEKGRAVKAKRYYPAELFSMAVADFAPIEPWRWSPGADVVGIDRNVVEGRVS